MTYDGISSGCHCRHCFRASLLRYRTQAREDDSSRTFAAFRFYLFVARARLVIKRVNYGRSLPPHARFLPGSRRLYRLALIATL